MEPSEGSAEASVAPESVAAPEAAGDVSSAHRTSILWLTNASHAVNHFQNGMLSILYPAIMTELGFGYLELGVLTAVRNTLSSATQGFYGFLTPFLQRTRILAFSNMVMALGVVLSGFAVSFWTFVGARVFAATGSSAQHPIGASLLVGYFPRRRGTILAFNSSMAGIGGFVAPLLAGFMLYFMGWRQVFFLVAGLSAAMGVAYLFFGRRSPAPQAKEDEGGQTSRKLKQGLGNYRRVFRNRNMLLIALVMMVGAGGRGGGVNDAYLVPHMVNDLGLTIGLAAIAKSVQQAGGIAGPIAFGWLSDQVSRKRVIQASLVLSALGSWLIAFQGPSLLPLLISLAVYGAFTNSRMTLTQALVADSVSDAEVDAAFSVFYFIGFISAPIWAIVTGVLMEFFGFKFAFSILAFSYLAGVVLMFWVQESRSPARV